MLQLHNKPPKSKIFRFNFFVVAVTQLHFCFQLFTLFDCKNYLYNFTKYNKFQKIIFLKNYSISP